jgi:hypothetical protein
VPAPGSGAQARQATRPLAEASCLAPEAVATQSRMHGFAELDRYVELEIGGLDPDAAIPDLRAHFDGCPACREEHNSL